MRLRRLTRARASESDLRRLAKNWRFSICVRRVSEEFEKMFLRELEVGFFFWKREVFGRGEKGRKPELEALLIFCGVRRRKSTLELKRVIFLKCIVLRIFEKKTARRPKMRLRRLTPFTSPKPILRRLTKKCI